MFLLLLLFSGGKGASIFLTRAKEGEKNNNNILTFTEFHQTCLENTGQGIWSHGTGGEALVVKLRRDVGLTLLLPSCAETFEQAPKSAPAPPWMPLKDDDVRAKIPQGNSYMASNNVKFEENCIIQEKSMMRWCEDNFLQ